MGMRKYYEYMSKIGNENNNIKSETSNKKDDSTEQQIPDILQDIKKELWAIKDIAQFFLGISILNIIIIIIGLFWISSH